MWEDDYGLTILCCGWGTQMREEQQDLCDFVHHDDYQYGTVQEGTSLGSSS